MMTLKMRMKIIRRLKRYNAGNTYTVDDKLGEELLRNGFATLIKRTDAKKKVEAIAKVEATPTVVSPELPATPKPKKRKKRK